MKPEPFIRAVHGRIVAAAREGVPASIIARNLAWPLDRLRRVAHAHGIDLDIPAMPPAPEPKPPLVQLVDRLPEQQAAVLRLLRRTNGEIVSSALIAERLGIPQASVVTTLKKLRRRLAEAGIPLRVETIHIQAFHSGWRLVELPA